MALAGKGLLAVWHKIAPAAQADFLAWHDGEHIPERLAIPGFLRARRFAALAGTPDYCTLYEVAKRAVLAGAAYRSRYADPTPWTRRVMGEALAVARALCEVVYSAGTGAGAVLACLRFEGARDAGPIAALLQALLPEAAAVHLCRPELETGRSGARTKRSERRGDKPWIAFVEGSTPAALEALLAGPLAPSALSAFGAFRPDAGRYRLERDARPASGPAPN